MAPPAGAVEVGVIETRGTAEFDELMLAFIGRAAELGGNVAKVDAVSTSFGYVPSPAIDAFACGPYRAPRSCFELRSNAAEAVTIKIVGRAFHAENP